MNVAFPELPVDRFPVVLDMRHSEGQVEVDLLIPGSLFYFEGHFPFYPILPGVVQLDWAVHFARRHLPFETAITKTVRVKFSKPIRPGDRLRLVLAQTSARDRLSFTYGDDEGPRASGQITFGDP